MKRKVEDSNYARWSEDDLDQLKRLVEANVKHRVIADLLGRSMPSIKRKIWETKLSKTVNEKQTLYDDDTNPYIVWICDEMEARGLNVEAVLDRANIPYNRFYDYRKRGKAPWVADIGKLLNALGYHIEIVPNDPDKPKT